MQFLIRLALQCGRADWQQFLHEMTPEELDAILALNRIEPVLHEEREDMRVKFMTAAMINSMWGGSIEPYQLDYLGRDSETVEVSEEATKQNVIQAFGAVPLRVS